MSAVKIFTLNVRGLTDINSPKYQSIKQYIHSLKIDILILTETIFTHDYPFQNYERILSHGPGNAGIAIIITNKDVKIVGHKEIFPGRRIDLSILIDHNLWNITALYLPHNNQNQLTKQILETEGLFLPDLVIGDTNTSISTKDNPKYKANLQSKTLKSYLKKYNLVDAGKKHNNFVPTFVNHQTMTRIDKVFCNKERTSCISEFQVGITPYLYDHNYILITLGRKKRKINTWKFNSTLLSQKKFVEELKNFMKNTITKDYTKFPATKPDNRWKALKKKLRNFLKCKCRTQFEQLKKAQNKIKLLTNNKSKNLEEIKEIKQHLTEYSNQLNEIILAKNFKAMANRNPGIPTKSLSKYLERSNIKISKEKEITLNTLHDFYKELYQTETKIQKTTINKMFQNWDKEITDEENKSLTERITKEHINGILNNPKLSKFSTPGDDGIPYAVYITILDEIHKPLTELFNFWLFGGKMDSCFNKATIISLYKKGEPSDPTNWRPISLLNSDYKIYTSIINNRIKRIIPRLIKETQTGFVNGRFIIDNITILHEIIKKGHPDLLLIFLDIKKAFDSLNHTSIIKILIKLKIHPIYVKAIRNIYKSSTASITHQGENHNPFKILTGVKQGYPLSPTLFVLAMELLARTLQKKLSGIEIHNIKLTNSMFADDTTIMCEGSSDKLKADKILTKFQEATGLTINKNKSCYYTTKNTINDIPPIQEEKILGYMVNKEGLVTSLEKTIQIIKNITNRWRTLISDIRQRAMIWKCYCISKLWYNSWIINPNSEEINTLNNLQNWFIYQPNKPFENEKKYKRLMNKIRGEQSISKGGLGILDLQKKIQSFNINLIEKSYEKKSISYQILNKDHDENYGFVEHIIGWNEINNSLYDILLERGEPEANNKEEIHALRQKTKLALNSKKIYLILNPPPINPPLTKDQIILAGKLPKGLQSLWNTLNIAKINHKHKYLIWRYYNNLLPYNHQLNCPVCKTDNRLSKKHIFFDCIKIQSAFTKNILEINRITKQNGLQPIQKWDENTLHSLFNNPKGTILPHKLFIVPTIMYCIWLKLCESIHNKEPPSHLPSMIKNKIIKENKQIQNQRFPPKKTQPTTINTIQIATTKSQPSSTPQKELNMPDSEKLTLITNKTPRPTKKTYKNKTPKTTSTLNKRPRANKNQIGIIPSTEIISKKKKKKKEEPSEEVLLAQWSLPPRNKSLNKPNKLATQKNKLRNTVLSLPTLLSFYNNTTYTMILTKYDIEFPNNLKLLLESSKNKKNKKKNKNKIFPKKTQLQNEDEILWPTKELIFGHTLNKLDPLPRTPDETLLQLEDEEIIEYISARWSRIILKFTNNDTNTIKETFDRFRSE